jgi:hypothetical protein
MMQTREIRSHLPTLGGKKYDKILDKMIGRNHHGPKMMYSAWKPEAGHDGPQLG